MKLIVACLLFPLTVAQYGCTNCQTGYNTNSQYELRANRVPRNATAPQAAPSQSNGAVFPGLLSDFVGDRYTNQQRIEETKRLNMAYLATAAPFVPVQQGPFRVRPFSNPPLKSEDVQVSPLLPIIQFDVAPKVSTVVPQAMSRRATPETVQFHSDIAASALGVPARDDPVYSVTRSVPVAPRASGTHVPIVVDLGAAPSELDAEYVNEASKAIIAALSFSHPELVNDEIVLHFDDRKP